MSVWFNWKKLISGDAYEDPPEASAHRYAQTRPGPTLEPQVGEYQGQQTLADAPWKWDDQLTIGTAVLGAFLTLLLWLYIRRRGEKRKADTTLATQNGKIRAILDANGGQSMGDKPLDQRVEALEQLFRQVSAEQFETIETEIRKGLNKRVEALETRIKLDQEAIEDIHRALTQRMEALEECIKAIDSKHLDMEASHIVQRGLNQRLEAVEGTLQTVDSKTRASVQRLESIDDSVRVIDSRSKALSQRVEAVEDSIGSIDGQATLLSHDLSRGSLAIEKLQRQVKMLPDAEKFKGLSRAWETRFKKIETKIEQYKTSVDETLAERAQSVNLTLSDIDMQEIEPTGPFTERSMSMSFSEYATSSPSSSIRSPSSDCFSRSFSTASSSPITGIPMTPERRRLEMAGFREMTFSSKQKQLATRQSFTNAK